MSNEAPTMSDLIMSASTAQLDMDELEAYTAGVRRQVAEEIAQAIEAADQDGRAWVSEVRESDAEIAREHVRPT